MANTPKSHHEWFGFFDRAHQYRAIRTAHTNEFRAFVRWARAPGSFQTKSAGEKPFAVQYVVHPNFRPREAQTVFVVYDGTSFRVCCSG